MKETRSATPQVLMAKWCMKASDQCKSAVAVHLIEMILEGLYESLLDRLSKIQSLFT